MIKKLMNVVVLTAAVTSALMCVILTPPTTLSVYAQSPRPVSAKTSGADSGAYKNAVLRPGNPLNHNIKAADLESLRALLKQAVDSGSVPGVSLLLAHKGEVVFKEAFGNLTADQSVRIASSTKPVTATMVMILVDAGKLRLEDAITKFVPEFKGTAVERATVRDLLSHKSGILGQYPNGRPRSGTLAEFARGIAKDGRLIAPGKFSYSGVGMDIAARVAEIAGGMPYEELIKKYIWQPLGMKNSSFTLAAAPSSISSDARARNEGRYVSGGGGMSASLDDMAAFYQMHLNGGSYGGKRILTMQAATEMHSKQAVNERKIGDEFGGSEYGLGFYRDRVATNGEVLTFSHGGAFGTMPYADTDRELVGIFFSQTSLANVKPLIAAVQEKVREIIPPSRQVEVREDAKSATAATSQPAPDVKRGARQGARGGADRDPDAIFERMANGKEKVNREEFKRFFSERAGSRLAERPEMLDRFFERLDVNKDKFLTREEFAKASELLGGDRRGGKRGGLQN